MGKLRSGKPGGPSFRPNPPVKKNILPSRSIPMQRPGIVKPVRGASVNRAIAREIRRNNFQQTTQKVKLQPRFAVRPTNPVVKIMPKIPRPVTVVKKPIISPQIGLPDKKQKTAVKPTARPTPMQSGHVKQAIKPQIGSSLGNYQRSKGVITSSGMAIGAVALAGLVVNVASANPQISVETNTLSSSLEDLKTRSSLSKLLDEVNQLENDLMHALDLLESARKEGYAYQKDLDEIAYKAMDRWHEIKPEIVGIIPQQAEAFQKKMMTLKPQLVKVNNVLANPVSAAPVISDASSQVNGLTTELDVLESSIRNRFTDIRIQTAELTARLNLIHWSMDQLSQAKFTLEDGEDLFHAVQARWDQEGDEDPEGVLYITNQRLLFERKEKVATKKILFITTASEFVQEVLIDQKIETCSNEKAIHKGLFGNQDFLEITFADSKLGNISFHLNGQDCKLWVTWIQKAKSGEIANERSLGSGISFNDISGPLTDADILALQTEVNALQEVISLKAVREELSDLENDLRSLERKLGGLRGRGYFIEKNLETDIKVLATQWDRIKTNAEIALQSQITLLGEHMAKIQNDMSLLVAKTSNLDAARPLFLQIKSAIASTEAQADAGDDVVMITYDQYADEVESIAAHFEWIDWMLDAIATASFKLLATESGIAAAEATYSRPGLEPENGILYLTDQRLLWEDRVENYELKVNLPLQYITEVELPDVATSNRQSLRFQLSSSAPYSDVLFNLALPVGEAWVKMAGRARSGEYAIDRAVEIDPQELERIKNAPRQCSNCGAGFTAPILRGQTELTCEYCGQVTRI